MMSIVIMLYVTLVLYNLRSTYNVGAILRTADATGVDLVLAVGTTPYPEVAGDIRPPHVRSSNTRSIAKTALGAELTVPIRYHANMRTSLSELKAAGAHILALEQSPASQDLFTFAPGPEVTHVALILGPEVTGIESSILELCDGILEIPMRGTKESLNVSVAAGIALYKLRQS